MYNLGAGQWHPELRFSDPIFGSSETMVQGSLAGDFVGKPVICVLVVLGMSMSLNI